MFCQALNVAFLLFLIPSWGAESAMIYSSSAMMNLSLDRNSNNPYTAEGLYAVESNINGYLGPLLREDINVLSTNVAIQNQGIGYNSKGGEDANRLLLETKVTVIYVADKPVRIHDRLASSVNVDFLAAVLQVLDLIPSYGPADATSEIYDSSDDDSSGRTKADKGLVAATIFLSATLLFLTSVVIYTSGACSSCKGWVLNCLFEEVEDDLDDEQKSVSKGAYNNQDNFHVNTYDEESVSMSSLSMALQNETASGILGARGPHSDNSNPTAGLGIKTPVRPAGGNQMLDYDSELGETPLSQQTGIHQQPLGITSMRKMLPTNDSNPDSPGDRGGLARMIRLNFQEKQ